jgi:Rhodopirellula transposase DDE domain
MERETAGDPISGLKWTRKTTERIARQLKRLRITVSRNTVGRLLRQMKFSLRTNRKTISAGSTSDRDRQFRYLCRQRDQFEKRGDPVLSVDAKKRELIGNFKNPGAKWERTPIAVNDHDFRSAAQGIGIPYGIYDTQANRGSIFLGTSHETSAFAVSCLRKWWLQEGRKRYPQSSQILILADTGGSNGAQRGAWKQEIQRQLCDGLGLRVTVSPYPSGASKWNPIEHRLFQPDQQELGSRTTGQLRKSPQIHQNHHNYYRIKSDRTTGYHLLPNWHQALESGTQSTLHPPETRSPKMELHNFLATKCEIVFG